MIDTAQHKKKYSKSVNSLGVCGWQNDIASVLQKKSAVFGSALQN